MDGRCLQSPLGPSDAGPPPDASARIDASRDAGSPTDAGCESGVLCGRGLECCAVGEECVLDRCEPGCASGVRCGDDLAECCGAGQVCTGECATPGEACDFSFDCPPEQRCEPTLNRCLSRPSEACLLPPGSSTFEPALEWEWTGSEVDPTSDQVIVTPIVANLTDDDGDDDADRHDIPDVVFTSYGSNGQVGRLRLLRGTDGFEQWTAERGVCAFTTPAVADLDGDGRPEILTAGVAGTECRRSGVPVLAFNGDGELLWESRTADGTLVTVRAGLGGSPSAVDVDGDGRAEVIFDGLVLGADGVLLARARADLGANYDSGTSITVAADVDGDGTPELLGGNAAFRADGEPLWADAARQDGFVALGAFGIAESGVELVVVSYAEVYLRDALSGAIVWGPVAHPGGNFGGPPTVADFDGDGRPEFGVAGLTTYVVYDPDGAEPMAWTFDSVENGAAITGSSVFDFQADGRAEVVYADQCFLRAFDGATGEVIFQASNSSGTHSENPVIADVDDDGHAEILVVANRSSTTTPCEAMDGFEGQTNGVRVFGDARNEWVPTRRIWNQHAYHITNITEDARVPAREAPSWSRFNSYRLNAQDDAAFASNLLVSDVQVLARGCPSTLVLSARVVNRGSSGVRAGVSVAFYRGDVADPTQRLGVATTSEPLLPGNSTTVTIEVELAEPTERFDVLVVVDDDGEGAGQHRECDEADNARARLGAACPQLF